VFDSSGLDSVSSFVVASHLRALALGGRAVAVVLHQPSSRLFHLLDDLILLGNSQILYAGDAQSAPGVFNAAGFICPPLYNFADFGKSPWYINNSKQSHTQKNLLSKILRSARQCPKLV